jgi:hypothetical protein
LHVFNLNTLIYLLELGDLAKSNLIIHFPTILSRMPLAETNLVNMLDFIFIAIAFTRRILNCISAKGRENHAPAPPVSWLPLTEDPIMVAPPESQGSFWLWFLQANFIENPYSFSTHMLLSMHFHFLIITNIHVSCIFSKLISQCKCSYDSILLYSYIKYSRESLLLLSNFEVLLSNGCCLNSCCLIVAVWTIVVWTVTVQPLLFEHSSYF